MSRTREERTIIACIQYEKDHPAASGFHLVHRKGIQVTLEKLKRKVRDGDELVTLPIELKRNVFIVVSESNHQKGNKVVGVYPTQEKAARKMVRMFAEDIEKYKSIRIEEMETI